VWSWWARTHGEAVALLGLGDQWWANAENWYLAGLGAAMAGVSGSVLAHRERSAKDKKVQAERAEALRLLRENARKNSTARKLEYAIAEVCGVGRLEAVVDPETRAPVITREGKPLVKLVDGVKIVAVEEWTDHDGTPLGTGFTADGDLPATGASWERIAQGAIGLAAYLKLQKGCGITVDEGVHRGAFRMEVQTVDRMGDDFPYPEDLIKPRSADDDTPAGVELRGRRALIPMRYDNVTLAGEPNSGKSNTTHVLGIADVLADNALLFDIDLSGSLSEPYVRSWLQAVRSGDPEQIAEVPHPGVAMAAPNLPIAWLMTNRMLAAVVARKTRYRSLIKNGKLPLAPSPDLGGVPLMRLRVDEGGALKAGGLLGALTRENAEQIAGQGRPAAERVLWGGLRGVDEFIPIEVATAARTRIAMRPSQKQELGLYMGWDGMFPDLKRVQHSGMSYTRFGADSPTVVKYYAIGSEKGDSTEDVVADICARAAKWQPELDPVTRAVFNEPVKLDIDEVLIDFFRGGPDVEENEDGTLTITNFWENRWQFILPVLFPDDETPGDAPAERVPVTASASASAASTAAPTISKGVRPMTKGETAQNILNAGKNMTAAHTEMTEAMAAVQRRMDEVAARREAGLPETEEGGDLLGADETGDTPQPVEPVGQLGDEPAAGPDLLGADELPAEPPLTPAEIEVQRLNAQFAAPAAQPKRPGDPGVAPRPADKAPSPREQTMMMLRMISNAGAEGILAGRVRNQLNAVMERFGIEVSEQVFYGRLKKLSEPGFISQPWGPGPGAEPKGRWVITDAGTLYLNREG
jgi:hypothetical protein